MAESDTPASMAVFCDFENVALGVRDAKYARFDMSRVLERLLLKGNIVVRKAYCDWERYKEFKRPMHEASFELLDIPHVRQSGKNSADIRMVVDALDLCYTKPHLDTFVIISGDSDFSPLVSKLRENDKLVIGVGVRESTSDLLTANCDEFIFYDDLVRAEERPRRSRRGGKAKSRAAAKGEKPEKDAEGKEPEKGERDAAAEGEERALDLLLETVDDLFGERGDEDPIWGSMVKQTLKRRHPGFSERAAGYKTFNAMLEDAETRGLVKLQPDERSGGYIIKDYSND